MRDNKGFTFVEVMVAIAIIAIVVGGSTLSVNLINRANINKGMRVVDSDMDKLLTENLSKANASYLYIYQGSDDDYYAKFSDSLYTNVNAIEADANSSTMIENSNIEVIYMGDSDGSRNINGSNFLAITYNRSTNSVVAYHNGSQVFKDLSLIYATNGSKTAKVEIAYETGKHSFTS